MRKKGIILFLLFCFLSFSNFAQNSLINAWDSVPGILSRIKAPEFQSNTFNILDYGAVADGVTLSTSAINNAINACNQAGGGTVLVPSGTFLTGAITLKSNVNLHLSQGAVLSFSTDPAQYLPVVLTRFEGVECYNYSPFIYAYNQQNIAITGSGTLEGNSSYANWWDWKTSGDGDRTSLMTMGENGIDVASRVFGSGHKLRPVFVQPYNCINVLIDSISISNSPMWEINPVLCKNVIVSNVSISSHGVNNDGCNPECSKDVWIHHCTFDTGDDCIAIKSGRNNDGRRVNVSSENIVIQNCTMKDGHGGVVLGSEISGSVRNVFAENCVMSSSNLERALRVKTNSVRGGVIENVHLRNIQVGQVASYYIEVNMNYEEGDVGSFTPIVRNFSVQNLTGVTAPYVFGINCYTRSPLTCFLLKDCDLTASSLGTCTNVRKFQVVNSTVNGSIPFQPSISSSYQHAELYSAKNNWGFSNVIPSYSGKGYMEPCDSDNFISYILTRTKSEQDQLKFTYSNALANKNCELFVNGVSQGIITFPVNTSVVWSTVSRNVNLSSGDNVLKMVALDSTGEIMIDKFTASYVSDITDIKQVSGNDANIIVSPNPSATPPFIRFELASSMKVQFLICDETGKIVAKWEEKAQAGSNEILINTQLEKGCYFLQMRRQDGVIGKSTILIK